MANPTPQLQLSNQLCFALYSASRATTRAYGPILAELGLTYPQYLTMLVLWEAPEPLGVGKIGDLLNLDSGTLTPLLKRLQQLDLVDRARDPADERRVVVSLTERGRQLQKDAADIPARIFRQYDIDGSTARGLIRELTKISESLNLHSSASR
jgi:DNA-binding MarR family transcriptional regulator